MVNVNFYFIEIINKNHTLRKTTDRFNVEERARGVPKSELCGVHTWRRRDPCCEERLTWGLIGIIGQLCRYAGPASAIRASREPRDWLPLCMLLFACPTRPRRNTQSHHQNFRNSILSCNLNANEQSTNPWLGRKSHYLALIRLGFFSSCMYAYVQVVYLGYMKLISVFAPCDDNKM